MRTAEIARKTRETDIVVKLNLDGTGKGNIDTGIGFFDHMLNSFAVHSGFDLEVKAKGDLQVDCHHTVEDVGIVLGAALNRALGDKAGIARFGSSFIPMDEALGFCAVDISGRPFLIFNARFQNQRIGEFDTCMTEDFFRAFAFNGLFTLHLKEEYGVNDHHVCETLFKACAYGLKAAVNQSGGIKVLSAKGVL